jgi:hypothetical protein
MIVPRVPSPDVKREVAVNVFEDALMQLQVGRLATRMPYLIPAAQCTTHTTHESTELIPAVTLRARPNVCHPGISSPSYKSYLVPNDLVLRVPPQFLIYSISV